MDELLASFSSLPNLHPAVVHFPIALAFTALLVEIVYLFMPRRDWLDKSAATLYTLAALGAFAAYLAGKDAAGDLGEISARAEGILAHHARLALWTLITLVVAALFRVPSSYMKSKLKQNQAVTLRVIAVAVLLGGAGLVAKTSDLGGALVYQNGVAVFTAKAEQVAPPSQASMVHTEGNSSDHLVTGADGTLKWNPSAGGTGVPGGVLEALPGEDLTDIKAINKEGDGLAIESEGKKILVLPGTFDNVSVDARLDLSGFKGVTGLVHHALSMNEAMLFTVSDSGEGRLIKVDRGERKILESRKTKLPTGVVELRTTVAGHHLKGYVDGKKILHAHSPSGEAGRAGLYLDGKGTIRVISVTIQPIDEE